MPGVRQKVRLTKKFAEFLDGIDLSRSKVGDDIEVSEREARLLVAEGWALPPAASHEPAIAADKSPRGPRRAAGAQR